MAPQPANSERKDQRNPIFGISSGRGRQAARYGGLLVALVVSGAISAVAISFSYASSAGARSESALDSPTTATSTLTPLAVKPVEKPVYIEVTKYVNRTIEKPVYVDRPIEVVKTVPVYVNHTVYQDKPVYVDRIVEKPVYINRTVVVEKQVPVYSNPAPVAQSTSTPATQPAAPTPVSSTPKVTTTSTNTSQPPTQKEKSSSPKNTHPIAPPHGHENKLIREFKGAVQKFSVPGPLSESTNDKLASAPVKAILNGD